MAPRKQQQPYTVVFGPGFMKSLKELEKSGFKYVRKRLKELIEEFRNDPYTSRAKVDIKLISTKDESLYRVRLGKFRLIYEVDENAHTVLISKISFRKKIYRSLREPGVDYMEESDQGDSEDWESDEVFYKRALAEHRKIMKEVQAGEFIKAKDLDEAMRLLEEEENDEGSS